MKQIANSAGLASAALGFQFSVLVSLTLLSSSHASAAETDTYRIPVNVFAGEVRGPFQTGTFEELWVDSTRDETTTTDPADRRHLMVQVWYPAQFSGDPQRAPYAFRPDLYPQDDNRKWLKDAAAVRTTSVLNAAVARQPERFAVLIYNPGGGHPHFSATFQTEFLASHGYVVVAVAHTGITYIERFPDGYTYRPDINNHWMAEANSEEILMEARACFGQGSRELAEVAGKPFAELTEMQRFRLQLRRSIRVVMPTQMQDIQFALDRLQTLNETRGSRFHQRLDLERVGSLGWSIGGALSILATREEPRIKAGINLDGWLYTDVAESGTHKPIMQMHGASEALSAQPDQSAALRELGLIANSMNWQLYAKTTADWYDVTLNGATHADFSDRALFESAAPEQMHPRLAHDIINRFTLEFFDKYLRHRSQTPLLSGKQAYREVGLIKSR